jgi:hypothetical protein
MRLSAEPYASLGSDGNTMPTSFLTWSTMSLWASKRDQTVLIVEWRTHHPVAPCL